MNNDKILKDSIKKYLNENKKDKIEDNINITEKQIKYDSYKNKEINSE